jgi:CubicO group peptidase (beta-lactamase class C family)
MSKRLAVFSLLVSILVTMVSPAAATGGRPGSINAAAVPAAAINPAPSPTPAPALTPAPPGKDVYEDPSGFFSVPIPTNWKLNRTQAYVLLTDPDEQIKLYILTIKADGVEKALAAAWPVVDPQFNLPSQKVDQLPAPSGIDEMLQIVYDARSEDRLVVGFGERLKGDVVVVLIDADLGAFQKRASQVSIITSGLTLHAVKKTDLTGVVLRPLSAETLTQLEAYIADTMKRAQVPGAAVAIVQAGKMVYLKGFGVRELGRDDPVTPDTLMMIGSTGKTLTTMMMATVVDDGLMRWDTPVVKILPSFAVADPQLTQRITVQNLVCACTGVPRRDVELVFHGNQLTAEEVVRSLRTFQFFTKFGEAFQYSNQMVATGGYVAAVAAGADPNHLYQGYLAQMQQRVLNPIGMAASTFSFDKVEVSGDYAKPHGMELLGGYQPLTLDAERFLIPVAPAGALWSNASDMARYLITQLNQGVAPDGKRVVSAENLQVTRQPQVAITAEASYGLGWIVDTYKGLPVLHHGGNTFGFSTDLAFLPEAQLGIVVLANAQYSVFNEAVRFRLFELAFGQPEEHDKNFSYVLETLNKNAQETAGKLQKSFDQNAVAPYLGTFTNPTLGELTLALQDGKLIFSAGGFVSELRAYVDKEDPENKTGYLLVDPPLAVAMGVLFKFQKDGDGNLIVVFDVPPDKYTFTKSLPE